MFGKFLGNMDYVIRIFNMYVMFIFFKCLVDSIIYFIRSNLLIFIIILLKRIDLKKYLDLI